MQSDYAWADNRNVMRFLEIFKACSKSSRHFPYTHPVAHGARQKQETAMQDIKNARISQMIIEEMSRGADIRTAIDRVLGAGTWQRLVNELYDAFTARNAAEGGAA